MPKAKVARNDEVRMLRHERRLTQQELADAAGVSLFTVQSTEGGWHAPSTDSLMKIAAALGVPMEQILPKGKAPTSEFSSETGGDPKLQLPRTYVGRISAASGGSGGATARTVTVDVDALHAALQAVEAGLMTANDAEAKLLVGVS